MSCIGYQMHTRLTIACVSDTMPVESRDCNNRSAHGWVRVRLVSMRCTLKSDGRVEVETVEQGLISEIPSAARMMQDAKGMGKLELRGTPAEVVRPVYLELILQETIEIDER